MFYRYKHNAMFSSFFNGNPVTGDLLFPNETTKITGGDLLLKIVPFKQSPYTHFLFFHFKSNLFAIIQIDDTIQV